MPVFFYSFLLSKIAFAFAPGTLPVTIPGNASLNISNFSLIIKEKGAIPAFAVIAPLLVSYLFLLLIYFMALL